MKKRILFLIFGVVIGTWGCSFSAGTVQTPTQTPATEIETVVGATLQSVTPVPSENVPSEAAPTEAATQSAVGVPISYENVSFTIPGEVASGANTEKMTAVDSNSGAPWDVAPTHLRFTLTGYPLQGKFHEPRIFVYPAEDYAQNNSNAAEQIGRIRNILGGATPLQETLPTVPFFNAASQIAAGIKIVPLQNGSGVRSLTQYAQYAAPINNRELFYHFQGLTNDGKYYVVAILPVTAPILPEDEKPEAIVPEGGVPIPADVGPNEVYYFSVTEKLNSLAPDAFTPSLSALDTLIQSIVINP